MDWAAGHFRVRGLYCKLQNEFFPIGIKKTYSTDLVSKIFSYHISTVCLTGFGNYSYSHGTASNF